MAVVHRSQKDEALSPSSLAAQSPSMQISPVEDVHGSSSLKDISVVGIKIINTLKHTHQQNQSSLDKGVGGMSAQPSMDPNLDLAGNVMV